MPGSRLGFGQHAQRTSQVLLHESRARTRRCATWQEDLGAGRPLGDAGGIGGDVGAEELVGFKPVLGQLDGRCGDLGKVSVPKSRSAVVQESIAAGMTQW